MRYIEKETIKNVTYENGERVAVVEQVITRADDCAKIGELYVGLSDLYRRIEADISEKEREQLNAEIAKTKSEIDQYVTYLNGYKG